MSTLYIDCSSGISGDMTLGAFLDLGMPEDVLKNELDGMGMDEFRLEIKGGQRAGISCTDVDVILLNKENEGKHPYSGRYRNYGEIKEIISNSSLTERAKTIGKRVFEIKAAVEAKVHGVSIDDVQFHEAGAVDSIVDIVGMAICFDYLDIDYVVSTHVPTGYGTVKCACGELPVPAPAVKGILKAADIPHYRSDVEQELLTPTGASILAGIVDEFKSNLELPEGCKCGYGSGKRDTGLSPLCLYLK